MYYIPYRGIYGVQTEGYKRTNLTPIQNRTRTPQKVVQMVDDDTYCIKVIHQSHAIQQALKEIDNLTLEHHLKSCVTDAIKGGRQDEAVAEVMQVFKKSM